MQKYKKFLGLFLIILFVFNCTDFLFAGRRKPIKRVARKKTGKGGTVKKGGQKKKKIVRRREKTGSSVVKSSELGIELIDVIRDREINDDQRFDEVVELLQTQELFQADLDLALGWSVQKGCVDIVELLLKNKANVNAGNINPRKMTPLLIATHLYRKIIEKIGKDEFLRLLKVLIKDYKADVNKQNMYGSTALLNLAAAYGISRMRDQGAAGLIDGIFLLLDNGARANTRDNFNEYPYEGRSEGPLKELLMWQCYYDNCSKFKVLNPFLGIKIKKLKEKVRQMQ